MYTELSARYGIGLRTQRLPSLFNGIVYIVFCILFSYGFAGFYELENKHFFAGKFITVTTLMSGEDQIGSISLPSV